jgi:hypothetical protein
MKSYHVTDPDHPAYSDDAVGEESFWTHTRAALRTVEALMERVTAWSEQSGQLICRDCAEDAKASGARLTRTRVEQGRLCEYCGQEIGRDD